MEWEMGVLSRQGRAWTLRGVLNVRPFASSPPLESRYNRECCFMLIQLLIQLRNPRFVRAAFVLVTILVCSGGTLLAQAISGTVVGTVHDASGAVGPKADVTATRTDTGIGRSTVTNDDGEYTIPNLTPGIYEIAAKYTGFTT